MGRRHWRRSAMLQPQQHPPCNEGPRIVAPAPSQRPSTLSLQPKVDGSEQVTPATSSRKRKIDSDNNSDNNSDENRSKRARLTRENLTIFNQMAKKRINKDLASTIPETTAQSSATRTTSTTMAGFAMQARKNGMLEPRYSLPPANLEDIRERLAASRATASPSKSMYEHYNDAVQGAVNEATMVYQVGRNLLKHYDDKGYKMAFNQAFTVFPKDDLKMEGFLPFPVDEDVSGAVLYKDNLLSVTLPHLAGEWKGTGKDMSEAQLQSGYDGAALVYARNEALSYVRTSDPCNHAAVTTFTTDGTSLNFYAHYAAPSDDGVEYHQYLVRSMNLRNSHQVHKDCRRSIRNEQDHARKQSCDLKDQLKEHWKQRRTTYRPVAERAAVPVADGSVNELYAREDEAGYELLDHNVAEKPCQPTPAASSRSCETSSAMPMPMSHPCTNDDFPGRGGQKRKALSPSTSSRKSSRR